MAGLHVGVIYIDGGVLGSLDVSGNAMITGSATIDGILTVGRENSSGSTVLEVARIQTTTSAAATTGLGPALYFASENAAGNVIDLGYITMQLSTATAGSETSTFSIFTKIGAPLSQSVNIDANNAFRIRGTLVFDGGNAIRTSIANTGITLQGNRNASDSGQDITLRSTATRTNGYIASFDNLTTRRFGIKFNGVTDFYASSQASVGSNGSAAALPTPAGYVTVAVSGTETYVMAYYNKT